MFRNYLTTAFRNLSRNKIYSFINIAGLSIALSCVMLIALYVKDEVSFDRFHKNVKNIYRIASKTTAPGKEQETGLTGYLEGPRFTQNVPGVKSFVRVKNRIENIQKGTEVQEQNVMLVDSTFFSVFSFPLIDGDVNTCLTEPHSIVLSEDAAIKQFGTMNAVGQTVMIKGDTSFIPYKVTAVAKRCPQNSSLQFDVLMPIKVSEAEANDNRNWFNAYLNTFVVLDDNANPQTVEHQMQRFYRQDSKDIYNELITKFPRFDTGAYFLRSFLSVHLDTRLSDGIKTASNPMYSYILSAIALFVLLIACINFVNLSVARSVKRAKEIGIRKVIGSNRKQLLMQFLGESFLLCTIAFVIAIILAQLILPFFNSLANKALSLSYLFDVKLIAVYIALYVITGLLAGFYPALVLSGYKPVQTLNNRFQVAGKNYLQKSLVVLQFTLASFLIIATFTIYAQFNLLTKTELGYDDANLVIVNKRKLEQPGASVFINTLLKNPSIVGASVKNPGVLQVDAKIAGNSTINFQCETVDENYLPLLKLPLLAGRNFSPDFPSDPRESVIVNESFAKAANWKNPVGEVVSFDNQTYHVIGVVKDYHFASLTEKIIPQLFTTNTDNYLGSYYIKIKPATAAASLKWIQQTFQQFYPLDPFSYVFKIDENRLQYANIEKWTQIILFGAVLTIFISCIGLFGLSVLSAERRTREIGIRKVLGASVRQIVTSLSTDFMKLVVIALVLSSPLAYIAANKWLQNFPYRVQLSWWLFTSAGLLVIFIALFTVSFQSIRAAIVNPVKSLRTE